MVFGFLKKNNFDKTVILYVGRKDKIVPFITKARRVKDDVLGVHFEVLNPNNNKVIHKVGDIPTKHFSSSGIIELYTPDFEQFIPCGTSENGKNTDVVGSGVKVAKLSINDIKSLELNLLTSDQKVWYAKSVKEDYLRTLKKTWWNENKTIIFTIIVLVALCVITYIMFNGILDAGALARDMMVESMKSPIPYNSTMPPV